MKKLFFAISLMIFGNQFINAQNVYESYQDGVLIFQLNIHEREVIKSKNGIVEIEKIEYLNQLKQQFGIQEVKQLFPNHKDAKLERTYQIEFAYADKIDAFVRILGGNEKIEYAEKKELHHTTLTPNDQFFVNATNNGQWALFRINAQQAWDISTGDAGTIVAVTDNAINVNHPDLVNKMLPGHDATTGGNSPLPCGSNDGFHGSHVSGIVGAQSNNTIGIASIGYNISILPVKIGNCNGALTAGFEGIVWSADNGADVINMSWGGAGSSTYGQNVCNYAWNQGAILVAAAGNDGVNSVFYPAGYNNVISVASSTTNDAKSNFSNFGAWIDITAPGSSILSCNAGTGYQVTQGTSMASPLVAGLLGLMKSHALSATNTDLINCLYSSATNIDAANPSFINQLGAGRINAHQAMICANNFTLTLDAAISDISSPVGNLCTDTYTPSVTLRNLGSTTITSATITYQVSGSGPQVFNWTGSLASTQSQVVSLPNITSPSGNYTFTATVSNPNGGSDQNAANNSLSTNFSVIPNGDQVTLNLLTDCYGSEITWNIEDDLGNLIISGGPYTDVPGGQNNTETFCLAPGCYTFNIADTYGDGMNGAQWNGCSVNGNYSITDGSSNVLVQMTAPNAAFGNGTSHNFCLASPLADDAGITSITSPSGGVCNTSITPIVEIQNYGNQNLTSAIIRYQLGNGTLQSFAWSGNLGVNQATQVTLPLLTASNGSQTFTAYTVNPNGNTDLNNLNDTSSVSVVVYNTSLPLPFTEDFENGFANQNWLINNPDNSFTWEIATITGTTPGNQAAKMNYFQYAEQGRRDEMITAPLDFSTHSTVDLYFEHAYRRYDQNSSDSLIIYVSSDCGQTYNRVFAAGENGTGTFATATTTTVSFTPAQTNEWCMGTVGADCFTVNLDAYAGQSSVLVKFESYNAGTNGNNLFIDNINIDGTLSQTCPTNPSANVSNINCNGANNGTITLSASGGVAPLTYSIDGTNYVSSNQFSNVGAGTYTVYVRDANSCEVSTTATISQPTAVTHNAVTVNATCQANDGQITVSANGGTPPYLYSIDNNSTTQTSGTFTGLVANTYLVVVTDANGCATNAISETITAPGAPTVTSTPIGTTCNNSNGSITLTASNGATPYSYSIDGGNNFQTSNVFNGLGSGTYNIVLQDNNGCQAFNSTTISNTGGNFTLVVSNDETICEGNNTTISASGAGTGASYSWDNGLGNGASQQVSPNVPTTYTVTAVDAGGCSQQETVTINVLSTPNVTVIATSDTICSGETITLVANGAQTYSWNTGVSSSALTVSPNATTNYTVIGQNGSCSGTPVTTEIYVYSSPIVNANADVTTVNVGQTINFDVSNSNATSYTWDFGDGNNDTQSNTSHSYAFPGTYTVTLSGSNDECSGSDQITIVVEQGSDVGLNTIEGVNFSLYPNPTNAEFNIVIQTPEAQSFEVIIYDMLGKEIEMRRQLISNQDVITFNIAQFPNGIYWVKLQNANESVVKKIVLNK